MHLQHDEATSTEADGTTGRNLTMMLNVTDEPPALLPRPTPPTPENTKPRPRLPRWPVPLVAVLVAAATVAALVVLWRWIDGLALADAEKRATAQLDALKLAASIVVGGGGLFALYLAARRQRTQEMELDARHAELTQRDRVQVHAEQVAETNRLHAERVAHDARVHAEAQRITELYAKSAEQLGSDKAPVRLAGLYALERLAQDNPRQRPTVASVLCAYLRMPYTLPGDPSRNDVDEQTWTRYEERVQEHQVRLTAQHILAIHLRPGPGGLDKPVDTFWSDIDLDLTGATLIDFKLDQSHLNGARFGGATFTRNTNFGGAAFTEGAWFEGAKFTGSASFIGATFTGNTYFGGTAFIDIAMFEGAIFTEVALFDGATFTGPARFDRATFTGPTRFSGAAFTGPTWLAGAVYTEGGKEMMFPGDRGFDDLVIPHPMRTDSSWPAGWRPADEHAPVNGREGTWHRLIRIDPRLTGDDQRFE